MREQLNRVLKTPEILFIGVNGVIGGGIFLLPGQVAGLAGPNAVWAYLAAGVMVMLIGLAFAELGGRFDRTGGPSVYAEEAMGKTVGFTVGWSVWLTYVIGWGVLSDGFVSYLGSVWPGIVPYENAVIIGLVLLLCLLNTLGVRFGTRLIQVFTVSKLVPLLVLVVAGLTFAGAPGNATLGLVPEGSGGFFAAVLIIIFAYGGFEATAIPAGEMVNPRRTIAIATIGTLGAVTVFYMLIQYTAMRIEPGLADAESPLAAVGGLMFAGGLLFMTIGALISIAGTKSGVAFVAPRGLYALSQDGMLPGFLGRVSPRFKTPVVSIWMTGAVVIVLAVTGTFATLILLNVAARLYQYLMVCISAAIIRVRDGEPGDATEGPNAGRRFSLPLGPVIPVVAALMCLYLLAFEQEPMNLLATVAALAVGLALYAAARATRSTTSEDSQE
ncbi:APC family permease [Rubrobacter indicoceani]|uniref:APC family permease n=1 Tax=Rubrobacter indicoceani TaxID=2051957 RepID=UPI000E5BEA6D|nr:APC family permease [Rubrobacter indicoceani]